MFLLDCPRYGEVEIGEADHRWESETAAELDAWLPSILDKAFKGEL